MAREEMVMAENKLRPKMVRCMCGKQYNVNDPIEALRHSVAGKHDAKSVKPSPGMPESSSFHPKPPEKK